MKIGRHEENPVVISEAAQARHRAIVAQGARAFCGALGFFLGSGLKFRDGNAQELLDWRDPGQPHFRVCWDAIRPRRAGAKSPAGECFR